MIHAVTVYCSSSIAIDRAYFIAGRDLGDAIARNGWKLVYGGNNVGLMGVLADSVRAAGGKVIGVTPQLFIDKGLDDKNCDEFIVTSGMRERKATMEVRGDAFIALPGGLGTFEEVFEIIVGKQLALHNKPIVLMNIKGYFNPLLDMIERGIEQRFIKDHAREYCFVTDSVDDAISHLRNYQPPVLADKWFTRIPSAAE
jgi:uncharacterized protein (TIGR00730 family)